ncbi:MAG: twin-arginine translocation signal domain-containing protein, partial [Deltaproteobacteria bacterium]|nr:twin-arginine translocation signal domain-containing protein [Deltaproteobacteria bacterium]
MKRRDFLKKAGVGAAAVAATTVSAPFVHAAKKTTIKWRMQTYAGAALSAHVCKPAIDAFNKVANGEMVIELYNADQLVPGGELFRAMQKGTIDAVQYDD